MREYVAFLRAVNVGKRVVKMERLRALFEELKFNEVSTFLASGNVLFQSNTSDAAALESTIEAQLRDALGFEVETFLRTPAELSAVVSFEPFSRAERENDGFALHVIFLRRCLDDEATARLAALRSAFDDFQVDGREVYWLCRGKVSDSKVTVPRLSKALGMPSTARNISTVRTLARDFKEAGRPSLSARRSTASSAVPPYEIIEKSRRIVLIIRRFLENRV